MKKQDISLLKIQSVIVHDVPRPRHIIKDTSLMVEYREKASQLTKELKKRYPQGCKPSSPPHLNDEKKDCKAKYSFKWHKFYSFYSGEARGNETTDHKSLVTA